MIGMIKDNLEAAKEKIEKGDSREGMRHIEDALLGVYAFQLNAKKAIDLLDDLRARLESGELEADEVIGDITDIFYMLDDLVSV